MRVIGLTGGIASGKSTVSREMLRRGYPVIDGDQLSRELTCPGGEAIPAIRSVFGDRYLNADGSMNRREMGKLVFSDPAAREQLDRVMAPFLRSLTARRITEARETGAMLCFLDMSLLFEKGYDQLCDTVWSMWLPEHLQLERLVARDGYSPAEALSRIHAAMSSDEKARLASAVIDNSGSIDETISQADVLLERELARADNAPRRRRTQRAAAAVPEAREAQPLPLQSDPFVPIERPESSRRKPSARRASWKTPRALTVCLISFSAVLAVSLTAQLLMSAYLVRRDQQHLAEQQAVDAQYPLSYSDLILRTSSEYNLSPALVASIIRNESSFRPMAESSVGARGLMQLMPKTAEWIAHKLRLDSEYRFDQMYDPATNIRYGCWYLDYLSTLFRGDPLCVVCAYHAGQGEVSSWLSNPLYSTDGKTLKLDSLPDGPTKTYAGRVTRDYGIYLAKYFRPAASDAAGPDPAAE